MKKEIRKFLPEIPELVDKLSIVTLKSIKLGCKNPIKKEAYEKEAQLIMHDIDLLIREKMKDVKDWGKLIRAIGIIWFTNNVIWENETLARQGGASQNHLLPFTHSVNGMRMRAGNAIVAQLGGREDLNLDRVNDKISEERGYDWNELFK